MQSASLYKDWKTFENHVNDEHKCTGASAAEYEDPLHITAFN